MIRICSIAHNSLIHDIKLRQYTITIIILVTVGILMKHKLIGYGLAIATLTVFYIEPATSGWNVLTGLVCLIAGAYYIYKSEAILGNILLLISLMVNIVFNWYVM